MVADWRYNGDNAVDSFNGAVTLRELCNGGYYALTHQKKKEEVRDLK
jgi:hypothetical protein